MWLNPGRWLLYGALVAALLLGVHTLDTSRQAIGYDRAKSKWDADKLSQANATLKASEAARAAEKALQAKVTKAQDEAKKRETKLAADAATARLINDGLRLDLAAIGRRIPALTRDAVDQYATNSTELLGECSAAYQDMAATADRHASDAMTLQKAWPR
jgi:hypothetical protein